MLWIIIHFSPHANEKLKTSEKGLEEWQFATFAKSVIEMRVL